MVETAELYLAAADCVAFRRALLHWYGHNQRQLPWRQVKDPYRIWASEIMLQQTQVNTVIAYYHRFLHRFPDIFALAAADLQDVLKCWEGLGYYSRARNFHRAAQTLVAENEGSIPKQWPAFRSLPGVGDYIAAAVLSIAFGLPYPVVDGNVKRLLARLFEVPVPANRSSSYKIFMNGASLLFDKSAPGIFNQAMMELGALVCKLRHPLCEACPVQKWCRARQHDTVDAHPVRDNIRPVPHYRMVIGVVIKGRHLLIVQRPLEQMLGGLWEFPGGRRLPEESAESACARNVRETVGLDVSVASRLTGIRHAYTHFRIAAEIFVCRYNGGRVRRNGPIAHRWVGLRALERYPFPGSHHKFMPALMDFLGEGKNIAMNSANDN